MTAAPVLAGRGFPTMFGEIRDQNVTFCVDTSGSMYNNLSVVKDHLTEALLKVAYTAPDKMFNIIEFSTEVDQWADRMVKCTPHTVTRAAGWIRALTPKTGTNTLDALLTALGDPECTAVYLVTDGLPDQAPHDILQHVAYSSRGRPIHCIFLTHTFADAAAHDFLQDVAVQTRGSFHIITLTVEGNVHRVTPVYRADHSGKRPLGGPLYPPLKSSSVMTRLDHNPFLEGTDPTPIVTYTPWEPVVSYAPLETVVTVPSVATGTYTRPLKLRNTITGKIVDMTSLEFSPSASLIMRGTRVLARRDEDGYYYMGTVANQLPDAKGRFMIEFDKVPTLKSRMQETGIYDMIAHLDAFRHKIVPGDKVLAPWEVTGQRFGPGSVLEGVERRFEDNIDDDEDLVVTFWNGKTESVPRHKAIWIPLMLYERVIFELQMPVAAREKFLEANPGWPYESPPGYPSTYIVGDPVEFTPPKPARIKSPHLVSSTRQSYMPTHYPTYPYPWYWYPVVPSALETKDDGKIPGANVTKDQLNRKVLQQLRENKLLLDDTREEMKDLRRSIKKSKSIDSGLSSLSDYEDWYEYEDFTPRDKSTNTDWSLYKETQGTQKDERPPWRYWSRTPRSPVSKAPHPPTSKPTKRYPAFRDTTVDTPMELLRGPNDEQVVEPPVVPRGSYGQTNSCRLTPARPYTAPGGGNERRVTVVTGPNDYDYSVFNTVNHSQPPAQPPQGPPNKSSAFQNVDHTFRRSINMREAMMHPQPPPASPYLAQRQGYPLHETMGRNQNILGQEEAENTLSEFRRRREMLRRQSEHRQKSEAEEKAAAIQAAKRQQALQFIKQDIDRHESNEKKVHNAIEAKRCVTNSIQQYEKNREDVHFQRDQERVAALQQRQVRHEVLQQQRMQEKDDTVRRRREGHEARIAMHNLESEIKYDIEQGKLQTRDVRRKIAESQRREFFHKKEMAAQEKKNLKATLDEQKLQMYRSHVLP
ncbi:C11orf16 [Branchiostoma lanceolatum]|uniref:C11orf16 protein n=1 Tax=Branchiostoma lanceolatum TaxID=7740 RepID=A0A8K0EFW5_BRALA|nr:C11orf16 [Branchiostoma lanceolatum]